MISEWTCSRPPKPQPHRRCAIARRSPIDSNGISRISSRAGRRGRRRTPASKRRLRGTRRCRARSRKGADELLARAEARGRHRPAHLQGLVLRLAALRRGSARQPDQREAPAGADPVREGQPGDAPGSTPSCWRSRCATVQQWMAANRELAVYRFAIEDLYRQQEHVLDEKGEHLLSLAEPLFVDAERRLRGALDGRREASDDRAVDRAQTVTLTYGQYRAILATNRNQAGPRARRSPRSTSCYDANVNTYASLYNGVLQRDWFHAQARGYALDARRGAARQQHSAGGRREPDRDDESRHRAAAALPSAAQAGARPRHVPHATTRRFRSSTSIASIRTTTCSSGCRRRWRRSAPSISGRCARRCAATGSTSTRIPGKRSGAYSAPVYGVHPYMLLNYNDTLDAVFTLAHEMGHSMHTLLSNAHQPFVYAGYTIFVAEVPSTLSEALFLDYMLAHADRRARAHRAAAARHRRHRRHVLHAGDVRRLRAAGAPAGRRGQAGHRRRARRHLLRPAARRTTATRSTTTSCRGSRGRASRTSTARRITSISTRPASRRARS